MKTSTTSRGNPDGPDFYGNEIDLVHYKVAKTSDGTRESYPICLNGAYNIRWNTNVNKVTCPVCIVKINSGYFGI